MRIRTKNPNNESEKETTSQHNSLYSPQANDPPEDKFVTIYLTVCSASCLRKLMEQELHIFMINDQELETW